MPDEPRMPGPYQRFRGGERGKFEVTGDFPSVSAEQRRLLLEELLLKQFKEAGWPEITLSGKIAYVPDWERGFQTSTVKIVMNVPVYIAENGKDVLVFNVPPSGDWSLIIIQRVLNYVGRWIEKLPPKP